MTHDPDCEVCRNVEFLHKEHKRKHPHGPWPDCPWCAKPKPKPQI